MKTQRHAAILRVVRRHRVRSQEELRGLLAEEGIVVTQATLSRDLHQLQLVKVADPGGSSHYALPPERAVLQPNLHQVLPTPARVARWRRQPARPAHAGRKCQHPGERH